jgi:hypothetical protein
MIIAKIETPAWSCATCHSPFDRRGESNKVAFLACEVPFRLAVLHFGLVVSHMERTHSGEFILAY